MDIDTELPESFNQATRSMFELLRGQDRPNILTAVDQAYEWIWRQQIFLPGKTARRLSDVVLAGQLQISRTPVRQALDRLAQEGLVQFDPRRGYWTQVFSAEDVNEIYDIREANEVLALRLAIPNLKKADLQAHLATIHSIRKSLPLADNAAFLESDFRLHNLIINSSENTRLIRFLGALRSQVALFQVRDTWYPQRIEIALDDHERFLVALIEGRDEEAINLLSAHIKNAKNGVLADMYSDEDKKPA